MRAKERSTWTQDLLLLSHHASLTHGSPWAGTELSLHGELEKRSALLLPLWRQARTMLPSTRAVLAVWAPAPRECFALCRLQLQFFTPRILLLHSFSLSQDSRISKALLVLSLTEIFVKHIPTILKCSFYCGVLRGCLSGKVTVWSVSPIAFWWVHCAIMILAMYHGKNSLSRKLGGKRRGRRRNREIKTNKQKQLLGDEPEFFIPRRLIQNEKV